MGCSSSRRTPTENRGFYEGLPGRGTKLVFVDRGAPGVSADLVATDNVGGGRMAGEHWLRPGRRRLCFLTTPSGEREATCVRGRLEGFSAALRAAGVTPTVAGCETTDASPEERFACEAMRRHILSGEIPDGLLASNDSLAYGAIRALEGRRKSGFLPLAW